MSIQQLPSDRDRIEELMKLSKKPLFEESSDDDLSIVSSRQLNHIETLRIKRYGKSNKICKYQPELHRRKLNTAVENEIIRKHDIGFLAIRASNTSFSYKEIHLALNIIEVVPRWFTHCSRIKTYEDVDNIVEYLRRQYGGAWNAKMKDHIAEHPYTSTRSSPMLQNMQCSDYMYVAFYYALKSNDSVEEDLNKCFNKITSSFGAIM